MKLNRDIRLAMATYYSHRGRQHKVRRQNADTVLAGGAIMLPMPAWDKQADLRAIEEAARRGGWTFQAVAGVFWFQQRTRSGKSTRTIECHEDDFLDDLKPFVATLEKSK